MVTSKKLTVGIDLGGTNIKFGLVSPEGRIIKKISLPTESHKGKNAVILKLKDGLKTISRGYENKIIGVGIGSPGNVLMEKGLVSNAHNIPGWGDVYLGKILQRASGLKTVVANDADSAAIGELIYGIGKKNPNFIMVTLGTGVGGGIIINGKIYRSASGSAGEIGHVSIDYNGRRCNCGGTGCVEAYIGNANLIKRTIENLQKHKTSLLYRAYRTNPSTFSPETIHAAAKNGDAFALTTIQETGMFLGKALISIINVLGIQTVVVGGGVSGFGKPLFDSVSQTIREGVITFHSSKVKVLRSSLKNDSGIVGASALVYYARVTK